MNIQFISLQDDHLPLLHRWFQADHIQRWYAGSRLWTQEEVNDHYSFQRLRRRSIQGFVILSGNQPIGYIQLYDIQNYPWEGQDLSQMPLKLAGIDFFIGESAFLRRGYGAASLQAFMLQKVYPIYHGCLVDPRLDNYPAIRCYQKAGFVPHQLIQHERELLLLMKKLHSGNN